MEKFWTKIERTAAPETKQHRIYNLLYLSGQFEKVEEIRSDFDEWSIADLEEALTHVRHHFSMEEGVEIEELAFGETEVIIHSEFFEAANQRDGAQTIWKYAAPKVRSRKFF